MAAANSKANSAEVRDRVKAKAKDRKA